jgi:2-keto-4-pentenoate hydratase/2-oxohepta-3-ene-1,7-dioic acid hydratase in catechol pathway
VDIASLPAARRASDAGEPARIDPSGASARRRLSDAFRSLPSGRKYPLADIRWHAPIPRPSKNVFCVGRNFLTHIEEGARARGQEVKLPEAPVFFTKAPTSVIGPHDDIPWDRSVTQKVDWEVELGAIIGRTGLNIPRSVALERLRLRPSTTSARDHREPLPVFKGKALTAAHRSLVVARWSVTTAQTLTLRVNGGRQQGTKA